MAALCLPALGDVVANAVRAGCGVVHLVQLASAQVGGMGVVCGMAGMGVGARIDMAALYKRRAVELARIGADAATVATCTVALCGEAVLLLR